MADHQLHPDPAVRTLIARERAAALREAADRWPREVNLETLRREAAASLRSIPAPYTAADWLRDRAEREALA